MKPLIALKDIAQLNLEFIQHRLRIKASPRKGVDYANLIQDIKDNYAPVFCLSPGRSGTAYLSRLMNLNFNTDVYHAPSPELIYHSQFAFNNGSKKELLDNVLLATRIELLQKSYLRNNFYFETNNRITFFAGSIHREFPKAKFIHLIRHPGEFIMSGIVRNWYTGKHPHDVGRITFHESDTWRRWSRLRKIAWLWNETHIYIEAFLANVPEGQKMIIRTDDLFGNLSIIRSIEEFITGVNSVPTRKFTKMKDRKVNTQTFDGFPNYREWCRSDIEDVLAVLDKEFIGRHGYRI